MLNQLKLNCLCYCLIKFPIHMKKFSWITSMITKCPFNPLAPINIKSIRLSFSFAEIVINKYGIRLSHIFEIPSISNEKHVAFRLKTLNFKWEILKYQVFQTLNFIKRVKSQVSCELYVYPLASASVVTYAYVDY